MPANYVRCATYARSKGDAVNQNRPEGRPVALSPGKHWVQVRSIDHSFKFRQWRDFDSTYGFELEAIAGHGYRLSERPASCVAPGNFDAAFESHRINRTEVSLID